MLIQSMFCSWETGTDAVITLIKITFSFNIQFDTNHVFLSNPADKHACKRNSLSPAHDYKEMCTPCTKLHTHAHTYTEAVIFNYTLCESNSQRLERNLECEKFGSDLAKLLCLTLTEQRIKHFSRQKRAMWHININNASIRHKFKRSYYNCASFDPLFICPFLRKGMYPNEQATANLLVTHVIQVCCESPLKRSSWGAFLPFPASVKL